MNWLYNLTHLSSSDPLKKSSNVVESPFDALRLPTDAAKRFKKVANATAVGWKMLLVAERRFGPTNSPVLLSAVAFGQQ